MIIMAVFAVPKVVWPKPAQAFNDSCGAAKSKVGNETQVYACP